MGTRNLTMVISEGKTKIAQYGQWDGYPSGQGVTALLFLKETDLAEFKKRVDALDFFTEKEIEEIDEMQDFRKAYPHLSRDLGAEILQTVFNGINGKLISQENFAADSLFCEWAYVVDFDRQTFEVYEGFNKTPLTESDRFYPMQGIAKGEYYPVKLLKSYPLNDLPTKEQFVSELEGVESED